MSPLAEVLVLVTEESVVEFGEILDDDDEAATVESIALSVTGTGSLSTLLDRLDGRDPGDNRVDGTNRGLDSGRLGIVLMLDGGLLLRMSELLEVSELIVGDFGGGGVGGGKLELEDVPLDDLVLVGHISGIRNRVEASLVPSAVSNSVPSSAVW